MPLCWIMAGKCLQANLSKACLVEIRVEDGGLWPEIDYFCLFILYRNMKVWEPGTVSRALVRACPSYPPLHYVVLLFHSPVIPGHGVGGCM